ncbi:MAG: DEAD/DEAH box helicase [Gemmataceae bacterium]
MTAFDRLHPAVQYQVANGLGWAALRPVQELTADAVLAGSNAVVLAPTAGGKTEAAFLPLLSETIRHDWPAPSVLYLSPIKALLNNQHDRLGRLYGLVGRRAGVWHGDVARSAKGRAVADPPDCLLTTPESVEGMLISPAVPRRIWAALRAVVVDEAHSFAGDDRGWHLLALVQRLQRLAGRDLQRVGLSATVGNPDDVLAWLSAGSARRRQLVRPPDAPGPAPEVALDHVGSLENAVRVVSALHRGEKRLVFCDSRSRVERVATGLRAAGVRTFVTHSSLSADERRRAEAAFASDRDCVIVATSTLELGIDVGDLDRVVQVDAPRTVSSFLQRMGRTGRRPGASRNCLVLATTDDALLRGAAVLRLWAAGYVEPADPPPLPLHILAQQVMALALQERGLGRGAWRDWVGAVPAFAPGALPDDLAAAVLAALHSRELVWDDAGVVCVGRAGDESYGRRNFVGLCGVFAAPPEFDVFCGPEELGSVHEDTFLDRPAGPAVLLLAGRSWWLKVVDWRRRRAYVEPAAEGGRSRWRGEGQPLSPAVCRAVHEILTGTEVPASWSRRARSGVAAARAGFDFLDPARTVVVSRGGEHTWWTFAGGRANLAIAAGVSRHSATPAGSDNLAVRFSAADAAEVVTRVRETPPGPPDPDPAAARGLKFADCLGDELAALVVRSRLADPAAVRQAVASPVRVTVLPP